MISRLLGFARPIAIIFVAVAIAVVMIKSKPPMESRSVDRTLPTVFVKTVLKTTVPVSIIAYGSVKAWRELELTAQLTGRITWQSPEFEPGKIVRVGEPLLRIDPTDYELALAEAQQALASAELALADAKALRQAARQTEAGAQVNSAKARITRAKRDLENTELVAPFTAVVDEQLVEPGQFISTGTRLGRILGADKAEIRLPIPPQDIGFVRTANDRDVVVSATVGSREIEWRAQLARIEARVDEQTRVFPVIVEVEAPLDTARHGDPLPFGTFVRASITGGELEDATVIPQSALHGENDVFLLLDGALQRRHVEVARISEGQALIVDGLSDGDQVVTTRLELMFEGMQVAPFDE
ncbi:MAG: efflux RND transporter periplasmic adaptor subunit [Congregibacter sp.]